MLSYRHAFHAGNHADVLKHITQALILEHLKQKAKPFVVIDTHGGGGLYDLRGEWSEKRAEYQDGVARLWKQPLPQSEGWLQVVEELNAENPSELRYYPGSPELTRRLLREQDQLIAMELHNNEFDQLDNNIGWDQRVALHHRDGFEGLIALTPPVIRRGLVLIDPPYEQKEDYQRAVEVLQKAHRRWATATYALWYPILGKASDRSRPMLDALKAAGFSDLLVAELEVKEQEADWGMNGSGMVIINPPWQLDNALAELLPPLTERLQQGAGAKYRLEWLARNE